MSPGYLELYGKGPDEHQQGAPQEFSASIRYQDRAGKSFQTGRGVKDKSSGNHHQENVEGGKPPDGARREFYIGLEGMPEKLINHRKAKAVFKRNRKPIGVKESVGPGVGKANCR